MRSPVLRRRSRSSGGGLRARSPPSPCSIRRASASARMRADVAVIGAGVVGAAIALALGRRGVGVPLLEAEPEPALAASGTNSGILHTGFDSTPGELETALILRSAQLRDPVIEALGLPVVRCGATLRPRDDAERARVAALAANAAANGVEVELNPDGSLDVPG